MQLRSYYKYACLPVGTLMLLYSVHLVRLYLVLRKKCSGVMFDSLWGQTGLCFLVAVTCVYLIYTVWQWITPHPASGRQLLCVTVIAVGLYLLLAYGFMEYHHEVYMRSTNHTGYAKFYGKGLWKNIKSLFR